MSERYEIVRASAGQGGFGRIDKATDTALERPVAIKTLDPLFKSKPSSDDVERFRREAKALAHLSHPNIPAIYDVQFLPDEDEFRIIFEWIEGETLRDRLQDRGVLSLDEARLYFAQVCSALAHAHEQGLVHRDVKPSNIILSSVVASCYLVDFGIALRTDDISRITKGTPLGSLGYMSPEQERGEEISTASDVFSLAVVLYESLAGMRPSVGGYKSLTLHNESIPPSVDELVRQSLQEDSSLRPQSSREFIDRFLASLRPHASFTSTLADGSLLEIQLALNAMTPSDYLALPPGQRILVATRLDDLITVDEERLRRAVASLIAEIVRLGHGDSRAAAYAKVIGYAFEYGFTKRYGDAWIGNALVRTALTDVSRTCNATAHAQIATDAIALANIDNLAEQQGWFPHDLRILLQNLLINLACDDSAAEAIGDALQHLNAVTH